MSSATTTPASGVANRRAFGRTRELLDSPAATYYLLLAVTALLVSVGLVMVLSASMIVSLKDDDTPFAVFKGQLVFAILGLVALVIAMRLPMSFWKRIGGLALLVAVFLQLLVVFTPLGTGQGGNRNWLDLKFTSLQPSELGKLALVLFGARVLAQKRRVLGDFREAMIPFVMPAAAIVLLLVMIGHDLGTAMVIAALVAGMLFAAGVRLRWFAAAGIGGVALLALATLTSSNRLGRINIWLNPSVCKPKNEDLYYGICRQPLHAQFALADGGVTGIGLGASKEKWQWLSEPHNDFIFAIIGEELGLIGALIVLALFAVFAYATYRLVVRTDDFFVRIAAVGVMVWILVQAIINIGAVIGTLPIIGVPLPFVSSGGSSLITTMLAAGMLLAFARAEPGCREALALRPSAVKGSMAVLGRARRKTTS
ncbi:MAG TPA: putative lipid II flippase FtsW [Tetrasphaera sp.]|uniref:putative lipid II flippase FtsW n=1 Tax=Nostocoides sp. TaxID=1917966 RepID=UPI002CE69059|nr:putative lipid II flippase FtsW [Tetrasphaera sp.]HNQ07838.1 putative lipid II flippase FtsW [Tetrasphaera sp.]